MFLVVQENLETRHVVSAYIMLSMLVLVSFHRGTYSVSCLPSLVKYLLCLWLQMCALGFALTLILPQSNARRYSGDHNLHLYETSTPSVMNKSRLCGY